MSLIGTPGDRYTLSDAVDALAASARWAGTPSLLWIAGIFYPSISLSPGSGSERAVQLLITGTITGRPVSGELAKQLALGAALIPVMLIGFRLTAGAALVSAPGIEGAPPRRVGLREAWDGGRGLTLSAAGLWMMLLFLLIVAVLFLMGPMAILKQLGVASTEFPGYLLLGPIVGLIAIYGLVLSVIYQLALHSLVHNRRGVASALIHAWRLVRNDPWATVRGMAVDIVLSILVLVVNAALIMFCLFPLVLCISGIAGLTRAAFWARNYRTLGGFMRPDAVPGIEVANPSARTRPG